MTFVTSAGSWTRLIPTVTLGSAGNVLESGTFPSTVRNLYVVIHAKRTASPSFGIQLGVSGTYGTASVYSRRRQRGGETSDATGSGGNWDLMESNSKDEYWIEGWITNPPTGTELGTKMAHFRNMEFSDGSGDVSNTGDWSCKWNVDDPINCIRLIDTNSNSGIDQGSTITVYGSVTEVLSYTYPNLPNGAIFEESDTGKHYMFDGSQTWNEMS